MTDQGTNKHGLTRHIPADVARAVRQRDGFGCVVCGKAIYEYEHISPEFWDAKEHRVDGIILLCGGCHRKKGKFLSVERILECAANPKAKQDGFSFEAFDISSVHPDIVIGPLRARNVGSIVEVDGRNLFSVSPPEMAGGPFRINAALFDKNGLAIMEIVENEWRTLSSNWDAEVIGSRIRVRSKRGDVALCLRSEPPNRIVIEQLNLAYGSTTIKAQEGKQIEIVTINGTEIVANGLDIDGSHTAIQVSAFGVTIGVGGGRVSIKSMSINSRRPARSTVLVPTGARSFLSHLLSSTSATSPSYPRRI